MHYRTSLPIRTLTELKNTIENKKESSNYINATDPSDKQTRNDVINKKDNHRQKLMNLKVVKTTTAKLKQNEAIFCGEAKLEEMFSN